MSVGAFEPVGLFERILSFGFARVANLYFAQQRTSEISVSARRRLLSGSDPWDVIGSGNKPNKDMPSERLPWEVIRGENSNNL